MKKRMKSFTFILAAAVLGLLMVPARTASAAGPETGGTGTVQPLSLAGSLTAIEESQAFHRYSTRKKSELSKLLYLMDRFKGTGYKVIYDGREYDSDQAALESKKFIAKNYKQEPAEDWVRYHAYRSNPGGNVIQVKTPDGELQLLRDLLMSELESLKRIETRHTPGK